MERNGLKDLRPLLPESITDGTKSIENFQNEVLRPIIKYQNDFLKSYFKNDPQFNSLVKQKTSRLKFEEDVKKFIGGQTSIKNQLIGSVIGLFDASELIFYCANKTALNKRIYSIISQRVSDIFY